MNTPPLTPRSRSFTRLTMRVGLPHFGQSVLLEVSMTFLRSAVLAIFAISNDDSVEDDGSILREEQRPGPNARLNGYRPMRAEPACSAEIRRRSLISASPEEAGLPREEELGANSSEALSLMMKKLA